MHFGWSMVFYHLYYFPANFLNLKEMQWEEHENCYFGINPDNKIVVDIKKKMSDQPWITMPIENVKNHLTSSPFDFNSFSKSLFEYNKKSFEIVSNATKKQAERLSQLNDKIHSFYKNELTSFNDATKTSETEVQNDVVEPKPTVKKPVARKTAKKPISK